MPSDAFDLHDALETIGASWDGSDWRMNGKKTTSPKIAKALAEAFEAVSRAEAREMVERHEVASEQAAGGDRRSEEEWWTLHGHISEAIFGLFRWAVDPNGRCKIFARTQLDSWQVREVIASPTDLHRELRDALMVVFRGYPESLAKLQADMRAVATALKIKDGASLEAWIRGGLNAQLLENPERCLPEPPVPVSDDPEVPCLLYVDAEQIAAGPHPAWKQVEAKMTADEVDVFRAYLWSIFDPVNHGRQGLWIKGGRATGKSVVVNAIARIMGGACAAVSSNSLTNQFWAAKVHRRRLVVYADCKYTRFLTDGKFHSVLGGDQVDVEHKNRSSESHRVHCRVIVGSNLSPEVNLESDDEASRVIMIELDNSRIDTSGFIADDGTLLGDGNFEEDLVAQFWAYLHECRDAYAELCPTRQNLRLPASVQDRILATCGSPDDALYATICDECLEFDPKADPIDATVFRGWAMKQSPSLRDNHVLGRLYQYLEKYHGVSRERKMDKGRRSTSIYGVRICYDLPQVRSRKKTVGGGAQ